MCCCLDCFGVALQFGGLVCLVLWWFGVACFVYFWMGCRFVCAL